jgi:hypothetical protein
VISELDRVLSTPHLLSTFEKRDLMRSLLLFCRDSKDVTIAHEVNIRVEIITALLPSREELGKEQGGSRAEKEIFRVVQSKL